MFKIVRVHRENISPSLDNLLLTVGVLGTLTFAATILSYQEFFLFNPLEVQDPIRRVFLFVTTVGWLTSLLGPITLLALNALGRRRSVVALPWVALAWPVSLVLNHLALLLETHKLYTGYLVVYPIFIATDIVLPLTYLLIARYLKHANR
jgi:hypothetical protein